MIGVFGEKFNLRGNYIGSDEFSCSFYCGDGYKYALNNKIDYGSKAEVGDKIDLILNLTTSYGTVEYVKNGKSMGTAFSGVKLLGKLRFGVSSYTNNDCF
jgi:hypothetical protein